MKLVDRYLLRELALPLIYCLLGFLLIFVVADLFEHLGDFLRLNIPLAGILAYYACALPAIAEYIVPVSLLLATLFSLSALTRHNELTAMRACGLSLYRLTLPFLGAGVFFTVLTAVVLETVSPSALEFTATFLNRHEEGVAEGDVHEGVAYYNRHETYLWWIDRIDLRSPGILHGVTITQENARGEETRIIAAERAEWLDGAWWLFQCVEEHPPPEGQGPPTRVVHRRPMELRLIRETPRDFVSELRRWEFLNSYEMYKYVARHGDLPSLELARKRVDLHRRLAMPWTCFIAILFGIPAGARTGRQGALAGVLFALAFFFGYYSFMQVGLFMGIQQSIPPWVGAWLPNALFGGIGIAMMARMR